MSSLPPLVSPPPSEQASSTSVQTPARRLVKPLGRPRDLDAERSRRAAYARGRKLRQQKRNLALSIGIPLAAFTVWLGWRAFTVFHPTWPSGVSISTDLSCHAPVAVGSNWFFASNEGAVWRASGGGGAPQKVWSGAFPGAPRVVALGDDLLVAGGDGTLARLHTTGKAQWNVQTPGALSSRPALWKNGATQSLIGADDTGHLWARDAKSGQTLWASDAGAPVGEGLTSTPWGIVTPLLGSATARGGLRCFDGTSGKPVWRFPLNARDRAAGTATPRYDAASKRVFWCNDEGAVFALDARTGRKIWKALSVPRSGSKTSVMLRASPVLADGVLVVGGSDGGLRAFDARDGHALWTRFGNEPLSTPLGKARFEGHLVVVAGANPLVLVDAHSGEVVRTLGSGTLAWNGSEFAGSDDAGVWHFWKS